MPSNGIYTTQYGYKCRGQRGWGRPDLFALHVDAAGPVQGAQLDFSLLSGVMLGKLRTDNQKSIVQSLQFTNDENGCADFVLKLSAPPKFDIFPNSILKIKIGNTNFNWYCGAVSYPDNVGTDREVLEYRGYGLRKYLEDLRAQTVYLAGTDITDVVDDIVQTWITPYCPIKYAAAKIDGPTGVVLAFDIELGKYSISEIMKTLILMAQTAGYYYIWGVDGDGEFYFTRISETLLKKTFFVGYNVNEFKPKLNFQDIKNTITVTRKEAAAVGGAGWAVAGVYNNVSSNKKYGRQELIYQVPGYFSNSDCDLIGNALISNLAEPRHSATAGGIRAYQGDDFLFNGLYRFIMPKQDNVFYTEILNDLDDYTAFTISGPGDLVLSNEPNIFMWANGGIKFNFQNALNQIAILNIAAKGFIKKIKFYVRSDTAGINIKVGVGVAAWNENTLTVPIDLAEMFVPVEWDLSSLSLQEVGKFGIQILANYITPVNLYIDYLEISLSGHKTYKIKLLRATYKYTPENSEVSAEFGGLPPSLVQYVAGLQKAASELKFTQEIV